MESSNSRARELGVSDCSVFLQLFELGEDAVPDLFVEGFFIDVLGHSTVFRVVCAEDKSVGGAEDGCWGTWP